jgi:hypothetical protein
VNVVEVQTLGNGWTNFVYRANVGWHDLCVRYGKYKGEMMNFDIIELYRDELQRRPALVFDANIGIKLEILTISQVRELALRAGYTGILNW